MIYWSSDVCSSDLAVGEPDETGHHDIAIGFELGRRHSGPCKRSEAAYAIAVKGGLRLEPLCDCRISASLRQNLIEQAAILIVQRIGSDCLDRLEHRKLAPFHGVENRVHLGQTNAHIFLPYSEVDVVLFGKETVYFAASDRRFLRPFTRFCRQQPLPTQTYQ